MKIHEYQGKEILRKFGVPVPRGIAAFTVQEAIEAAQKLGGPVWVVKAQIHAGGRGKGGGVKLARSMDEVRQLATEILGMQLVTHQTGQAHADSVRASYAQAQVEAEVLPFIDDMPARLAACDVVLCRAGAITVSELCAAGVPAILVPLVISTTSHQRDNAQWLAGHGAGIHLPQTELTPKRLAEVLGGLTREAFSEALVAGGLAAATPALRVLLGQVLAGR